MQIPVQTRLQDLPSLFATDYSNSAHLSVQGRIYLSILCLISKCSFRYSVLISQNTTATATTIQNKNIKGPQSQESI